MIPNIKEFYEKLKFKLRKVFDCQLMPAEIKSAFFLYAREIYDQNNDSYIDWPLDTEDPNEMDDNSYMLVAMVLR